MIWTFIFTIPAEAVFVEQRAAQFHQLSGARCLSRREVVWMQSGGASPSWSPALPSSIERLGCSSYLVFAAKHRL
jgi:hypothetical protein